MHQDATVLLIKTTLLLTGLHFQHHITVTLKLLNIICNGLSMVTGKTFMVICLERLKLHTMLHHKLLVVTLTSSDFQQRISSAKDSTQMSLKLKQLVFLTRFLLQQLLP